MSSTPTPSPPNTHTHTRTNIQYFLLIAVTFGNNHFLRGSDSVSPLTPSEWVWTHTRSLFFAVLIWIIAGGCSQKCITMINWTLRTYQAIQGQCAVKQEGTGTDVGQSGDVAACNCCSKRNVSRNLGLISAFEIWGTFRCWKCFWEARRAPPFRSSCRFMQWSQWLKKKEFSLIFVAVFTWYLTSYKYEHRVQKHTSAAASLSPCWWKEL